MANRAFQQQYIEEGAVYSAEIVPPERDEYGAKYAVDLVRDTVDERGQGREQRLTVGEHNSWMEAEEQLYEVEEALFEKGLEGWGEDAERLKQQPFAEDGFYITASFPPDAEPGEAEAKLLHIKEAGISASAVPDVAEADLALSEGQLPAPEPEPIYYFGYGVGPNNSPSLEAVKTWVDEGERRFDTLTIAEYDSFDEASVDEADFDLMQEQWGLQSAMNVAEAVAERNGYLDPEREDGRIFFEDDAPPDPFTTIRQRELAPPEYSVGAISANGESFLDVMKTWGVDEYERLTVPQPDWEQAQRNAERANDFMEKGMLDAAMQLVEEEAVSAGVLDPEREDPRLFTQGPLDPFTTEREMQIDEEWAPFGVTWYDTYQWEQEAQQREVQAPETPAWKLQALPVNNPEGEPLGYAMQMVVGESLEPWPSDPDAAPPVRMLEMAHFETTEAADEFGKEFQGYVKPGLLEGPELAEEVARLEGHPIEWKTLEDQELEDYRDLKLTLTRDPADWQPYNPNAERDARIEAEGLYTDPIHQFTTFDEDEDDPKVEPTAPDFDL